MSSHGLTSELVIRESFDETAKALKTIPSSATSFAIELDAADGDNVTAKPDINLINNTTATSCVGMKTVNLYVSGTGTAKVQVSGTDSGATFIDLPSSTIAAGSMSGPLSICARRIQIVFTIGTPTVNLVMQSV
jgi:hypothetical protein